MTLTNYFQQIITRQKQIGYLFPELLNPPAQNSEIRKVEDELGITFNQELIELYTFANGAKNNGLPYLKRGLIVCQDFLDLASAARMYNNYDELQEPLEMRLENEEADCFYNWHAEYIPGSKLFPLWFDGSGGCHWVDLNEGQKKLRQSFPNEHGW